MKRMFMVAVGLALCSATDAFAANCNDLPTEAQLRQAMIAAAKTHKIGGLFEGLRMWGALVNRDGEICGYVTTTPDPTQVWPGSQAIAKAKAYTANAFSLDDFALSTARLYTFTQPGHSLWSLGQSNLWHPAFNAPPRGEAGGNNQIAGGLIFFGGGVPLYRSGKIIGALGISGDTSCADHELAKWTRDELELNPAGGPLADDIVYSGVGDPAGAALFTHPKCIDTWRNNIFIGEEHAPSGY